jgi:esterase/lipase
VGGTLGDVRPNGCMKRILRKMALFGVPSLVAVWFVGDFVYSRVVQDRMRRWESSIEYSPSGVRAGCQAYALGSGDHALLLVHGFNDSPACFYQLAPALVARGFACRVMRLPGFGTTTADYATSDHRAWLRAIDEEVTALRNQHEHVSVVAHSMGGALAIRYLAAHPDAVESVVLLAPAVAVNNERSPLLSARAWHSIGSHTLFFTRMVENVYPVDAHSTAAQSYPFANRFVPQRATSEFFAVVDGVEECADRFQVPLLTVLTKDDLVIDWRAAERFHRRAASGRKKLCFIDDAGHVLPFDNGWQRIVQEITQFVRSTSTRLSQETKVNAYIVPAEHDMNIPKTLSWLLVHLAVTAASALATDRPNVVIIYGDDVGYADVGAYGSKLIPTPNIDKLANEGLMFTDGHCSAATCTPSRFSMLTGIHGFRHGVRVLAPNAPLKITAGMLTLPQLFNPASQTRWSIRSTSSRRLPVCWVSCSTKIKRSTVAIDCPHCLARATQDTAT